MASKPLAGDLRDRVAIQELPDPPVADAFGQHKAGPGDWETIATRRCLIRDLSGDEVFRARQVNAVADLAVDLRYFAPLARWKGEAVGPKMRLVELLGDTEVRTLNISLVRNPDSKRIWHLVLCKA